MTSARPAGGVPPVSGRIVNFNGAGYVAEAVRSLLEQEGVALEVVVVDNGSSDGSAEALEAAFGAAVQVVRAGRNLGFGGGNNLGLGACRGEWVLLLNSDAVAAPDLARELLARAEGHPRVGMVAPKVLQYDDRRVIDTAGHLLYPDGLNRGRGRLQRDLGQFDALTSALFPSGAAALHRRAMLDEIGGFDASFFLYGDDADLGLRARLAGWECAFAPRALAFHRYSRSVGPYSTLKAFHVERNRVWVLLKLLPWGMVAASPFYTLLRLGLQAWGALRGRGAAGRLARERSFAHLVGTTLRAYASALRGAPRVLRERRRVLRERRLDARAFRRLLADHRLGAREVALKD